MQTNATPLDPSLNQTLLLSGNILPAVNYIVHHYIRKKTVFLADVVMNTIINSIFHCPASV